MLHKAWNSKEEMPYCFPRSSIKFQGHTGQNITDFDPNWAFPDYRPVAAFKSLRFALLLLLLFSIFALFFIVKHSIGLRNGWAGWCETKRKYISWMPGQLCGWLQPWLWPLISKVKFWNDHTSGIWGLIDMEWRDASQMLDFDIGFKIKLWNSHILQWESRLTWYERVMSW